MAINKKLIHFNEKQNFEDKVAKNEILDTSIVFVKDSKEIWTHGNLYKSVNWSVLEDPSLRNWNYTVDIDNNTVIISVEFYTQILNAEPVIDTFDLVNSAGESAEIDDYYIRDCVIDSNKVLIYIYFDSGSQIENLAALWATLSYETKSGWHEVEFGV